jgi:hypothetical protein
MNSVASDLTNLVRILPTPGTETIPSLPSIPIFTEGQLIKATVQQVLDSVVWLKADGQMLQARTQLPLQPEQQVLLKVVEANSLRVHLQLQPSVPQNSSVDFKTLFTFWGLEADDINLIIADALLTHAQTINPDDVETIRTLWRTLPFLDPTLIANIGQEKEQLEALTYLHTSKLPINNETMELAQHWLKGLPPLTERLTNLQHVIDNVLLQLCSLEDSHHVRNELHDILLSVRTQIANWPISPDQPIEKVIAGLTALMLQLGMPSEAKVADLLHISLSSLSTSDLTTHLEPSNLMAILSSPKLAASFEEDGIPIHGTEAGKSIEPDSLQRLTSAVARILSQGNFDKTTTQVLYRLANQLDLLANDLGASHLANLVNINSPIVESCYSFPLLLATPDGSRHAQLKVYPQPGQQQIDPQNLRLAILLDLPSLGEIAIDLIIFEGHLNGKILSRQPQTQQRVEVELNQLQDSLTGLGYQVDALTSSLFATSTPKTHHSTLNGINLSI